MDNTHIKYFGKGFNFSQDGPGNRLVYHLYGCNFRCPWCSNPECFADDTKVTVQSVDDTVAEILRSRAMFFSHGGVTFTGGEPTLQYDALAQILARVKAEGVSTAVECNASNPRLAELFPLIDHLMLDLKLVDTDAHIRTVGASNVTVLENIRLAAARQCALRIPLVNGYNTDERSIDDFVRFLTSFDRHPEFTVELLAYHEYGKIKWAQHDLSYAVTNGFLSNEALTSIRKRFELEGIKIIHT